MRHALVRPLLVQIALSLTLMPAGLAFAASPPVHYWSQRFGSTGQDQGYGLAVHPSGDIIVSGEFNGTVNFGGANLVSAGGADIFLARYAPDGTHVASQRMGTTGSELNSLAAVDGAGNIYLLGNFTGTGNFGGANFVSAGFDVFLAKYNTSGVHQWSRVFGGAGTDFCNAIAVDASGNIVITGYYTGAVDFGGGPLPVGGANEIFLARYDTAGNHVWSQGFGAANSDVGSGVEITATGDVVFIGYFSNTVNFGGANLTSLGLTDVVLAKYTSAGAHLWSRRFGGTITDIGADLAVDASGNVYTTGYFGGISNFGGSNLTSAGIDDIFMAKYDATGTHQFSRRFGSTTSDRGRIITADSQGHVALGAIFQGTVNFGGSTLVSTSGYDVALASYTTNGDHRFSGAFGGTNGDEVYAVAVNNDADIFLTGYFDTSINFGGGVLTSAGSRDIPLACFAGNPAEPDITAITDIGNDQGRRVRIDFLSSGADDGRASTTQYEAYRRNDSPPAAAPETLSREELLTTGWTHVASVPAHGEDSYSIEAPTIGDSTVALGPYNSVFLIRAATDEPVVFFDSDPDSGYSLDNLAPGIPLNFVYESGELTWDESAADDFDFFTVYGANADNFGTAVVVDYSVAPTLDVSASPYVFYFVTATDFSGNEGKPAKVNTLSNAGGTPKSYVLSVSNYPNPFNPRTTVSYTLPSRGHVSVRVYDARGAFVATLVDGERAAGAYGADWNPGAAISSGVYFARIEHNGATRSKKMVLLK